MWLLIALGIILITIAFTADLIGLDLTPGFGVLQTATLLAGVTLLTIAIYLHLLERRPAGSYSLQADIGVRLSMTGLVLCYVSGFADLIGIGTHVGADFPRPFIGPLQFGGLVLGLLALVAGIILHFTSKGNRSTSSLESLFNERKG